MTITSRLPKVETSIFSVMSKMALENGALNLGQGFPDFPVSEKLIDLIYQQMRAGHNQYAPMPGVSPLREVIAGVALETYNRRVNPETEITITSGGTEAIFATIAALVGPEDEVIIFDPAYDCYDPAIRLNGGKPIHINLTPPHFSIDWEVVKSKISARTRMIMINTPHNPTGAILSANDLKILEGLAQQHGFLVLSDEVYERIIFDDLPHESILKYPALAARSIAIFSFGKTFHATGWKIGYAIAPEAISREIRKTHQFITFSVNTSIQMALAEYLTDPNSYLPLRGFYQKKRDFFLDQIKGSSLHPLPCKGSYFQLLSYPESFSKGDTEMAAWLTVEKKLASIPVSAFYEDKSDHRLLRFCFAKGEETLIKAGEILRGI